MSRAAGLFEQEILGEGLRRNNAHYYVKPLWATCGEMAGLARR